MVPRLQFMSSDSGPFPAVHGAWRSNLWTGTRKFLAGGADERIVPLHEAYRGTQDAKLSYICNFLELPWGQLSNLERARPIIGLPTPRGRAHVYT